MTHTVTATYRPVKVGACRAEMTQRPNGSLLVYNPEPLDNYPEKLTDRFTKWAKERPNQTWIAQRGTNGDWIKITYADGLTRIRRIASALLQRNLSAERPILILSGNDLEHALLGVAAQYAGIPYAPISTAYSLISKDYGKLRHVKKLLSPGLVFASDGEQYQGALQAIADDNLEVVVRKNPPKNATVFESLLAPGTEPTADQANEKVDADTIAKFLFTSGSSGMPKAVINTQRMLCANMAQSTAHFAYLNEEPPIILDWAPWNHTAGGNHNFNIVIYLGGTFYIDDGKPVPGLIEKTVENLREVCPNWYMNVPKGYAALVPYLQQDPALCSKFFSNLKLCMYAGAGIEPSVWKAIDELALNTTGHRIFFTTSLGSTETAPLAFVANQTMVGAGIVGLPAKGLTAKLVGGGPRWELRLKGPNITPGYWRSPELTANAFDEEGYYKLGDALRFIDVTDVNKGFRFDGRIGEDFKLATGTWVATGPLRLALNDALAPFAQDVVPIGADQNFIAAIVFLDIKASNEALRQSYTSINDLAQDETLHTALLERAQSFSQTATGSSNRIERLFIANWAPTIENGELTDKGAISYSGVVTNNKNLISRIFATPPNEDVICLNPGRQA